MSSDQNDTMSRGSGDAKVVAQTLEIVFEHQKKTPDGEIVLVPQPSDDHRDPLVSSL
jgi:hypothetical protein